MRHLFRFLLALFIYRFDCILTYLAFLESCFHFWVDQLDIFYLLQQKRISQYFCTLLFWSFFLNIIWCRRKWTVTRSSFLYLMYSSCVYLQRNPVHGVLIDNSTSKHPIIVGPFSTSTLALKSPYNKHSIYLKVKIHGNIHYS